MQDIFKADVTKPKGAELRRRRCEAFYELGDVLHTDFSGVGCPEMSKRIQGVMFSDWCFKLGTQDFCIVWRAADRCPTCRSIFHDELHRPLHVFGDLTERMPDEHRA